MNNQNNTKSSDKKNILGFGSLIFPIYDEINTTKKQAVKNNKLKLDLLCSAQAVIRKLRKLTHHQ